MDELQQGLKLQEWQCLQRLLEVRRALKTHEMQRARVLLHLQHMEAMGQLEAQPLHWEHSLDRGLAPQVPGRPILGDTPTDSPDGLPGLDRLARLLPAPDILGVSELAACPITEKRNANPATLRSRTLVVARFPKELTEEELAKSFDAIVGVLKVVRCCIVHESDTKCYALVEFFSEEAARQALQACDKCDFVLRDHKGAKWYVSASRAKRATAISKRQVAGSRAFDNDAWSSSAGKVFSL